MAKFYEQTINFCWECPEFYLGGDYPSECCRTNKAIDSNCIIQTWCPLPDNKVKRQMQWIPVSERLPENEEFVDVWIVDNDYEFRRAEIMFDKDSMVFVVQDIGDIDAFADKNEPHITHWMPLPPAPKDGDNK